jgi:MFS family permease
MDQMAVVGSLPWFVIAGASVAAGWLSDRLIRGGAQVSWVRIGFAAGGLAGATVIVLVPFIPGHVPAVVVLCLACLSYGVFSSNLWAVTQTLAGPAAAGKWTGIQNCFGNMAGIVAPYLTGIVVARTGHFSMAFAAVAIVQAIGACGYVFLVRRVEPVQWEAGHH